MSATDRPFRHLCSEADLRDAMDEGDFWAHVLLPPGEGEDRDYDPDDDWNAPPPEDVVMNPCEVCGEWGPCGYDAEGRILIHWIEPEADES